jgi:hypothetical protein
MRGMWDKLKDKRLRNDGGGNLRIEKKRSRRRERKRVSTSEIITPFSQVFSLPSLLLTTRVCLRRFACLGVGQPPLCFSFCPNFG